MNKSNITFFAIALILLLFCACKVQSESTPYGETSAETHDGGFSATEDPASTPENKVPFSFIPVFAEASVAGDCPNADLTAEELDFLWELYENRKIHNEDNGNESVFYIRFYCDYPEGYEPMSEGWRVIDWSIYEDMLSDEEYELVMSIADSYKIIDRSDETIQSAFAAAKAYCDEKGIEIERLWYDPICASKKICYDAATEAFQGNKFDKENVIILYYSGSDPSHSSVDRADFLQLVLKRSDESARWEVSSQGWTLAYVENTTWQHEDLIVEG